jgi:hypothetical protein
MSSPQSLHDFVLNLLNDPSGLTAFAADPQGTLNAAGLGGLDASDVHDIIPLVIDYAPIHLVGVLENAQSALSLGGLDAGQADAIQQLQAIAQSVGSVTTSVPSADPINTVTDALHDGLTAAPIVTGLGGVGGLDQVIGVTGLGNGSGIDLSNLGGLAGEAGHLGSTVGNVGNIGDLGSIDHLANLDGLSDLGGVGNLTGGDLGNIGNGDLGSVGDLGGLDHVGNLGLDHVGDLGSVGNLVNVGSLGNLVNVGNAVTVDNLGGANSVSDLASHNPVSSLLPGTVGTTVSHLTSTDALHSVTGGLQSDVTDTTSHSPVADGVSGSAVSGVLDHVQGDLAGLTHNVLPADGDHPLF